MSSNAPIPDVAQCYINWTIHGRLTQNQLFFRSTGGPVTQTNLDLLRARLNFTFRFNFLSGLGAGVVLRSIECADRSPGSTLQSNIVINAAPFTSVRALPSGIALSLIQYVNTPTEVHPSRAFVGGLREDKVTGNFVDTAAADSMKNLWATNNASHVSFGWHQVRVSLYLNGSPRPIGVSSDINGYAVGSYVVSQQRRRDTGSP